MRVSAPSEVVVASKKDEFSSMARTLSSVYRPAVPSKVMGGPYTGTPSSMKPSIGECRPGTERMWRGSASQYVKRLLREA